MIPAFELSGVLPPYLTNPADMGSCSPYRATVVELADVFATTLQRAHIVKGYLDYRVELNQAGLTDGFQWLDGSFVEQIEITENRPPNDIDVVTFFRRPNHARANADWQNFFGGVSHLFDAAATKRNFFCDAYPVDLDEPAEIVVLQTRYWFGLFSHRRVSRLWKGMLEVPLLTGPDDQAAAHTLNARFGI